MAGYTYAQARDVMVASSDSEEGYANFYFMLLSFCRKKITEFNIPIRLAQDLRKGGKYSHIFRKS